MYSILTEFLACYWSRGYHVINIWVGTWPIWMKINFSFWSDSLTLSHLNYSVETLPKWMKIKFSFWADYVTLSNYQGWLILSLSVAIGIQETTITIRIFTILIVHHSRNCEVNYSRVYSFDSWLNKKMVIVYIKCQKLSFSTRNNSYLSFECNTCSELAN